MTTTKTLVGEILELDDDLYNQAFLDAAESLVAKHCLGLDSDGVAYNSPAQLILIETWLSAHFYAMIDPRAIRERAGRVEQRFEWKTALFLSNTRYGQMAMTLDISGGLAGLNASVASGRRTASMDWLGKEDQTT